MTAYPFDPPPRAVLPIAGSDALFPIRRVLCVGRNYAAHIREMGQDERQPPFFFTKPADAVVPPGGAVPYPPQTGDLSFEIELVVAIGQAGVDLAEADAESIIHGYAAGVDLTRRDLQIAARDSGRPWDLGKGFDASAPCSAIHPVAATGHPKTGRIWLEVNGEVKQNGDLAEMIWKVPEIIATLSRSIALAPGDLIFTGTPSGIGPTRPGDRLRGGVDGVAEIAFEIAPARSGLRAVA
ncbi:fumarylacetoacetate hydrolase family protein [Ancylobacter terrae]|uniref:fumarylacetoacetate hydrolase family protein n=1 Tax=Ancylobacter sp. sgz301288 TaxID=3342077 RepID=UPI00385A04D5